MVYKSAINRASKQSSRLYTGELYHEKAVPYRIFDHLPKSAAHYG